ncbi:MAG: histidinol-phosphate transaminase [Rubripirellula sp.]|nr:histidinol-phosphate transaminase [Rubripirellula sp.]
MVNRKMYRPAVTALAGYVPGEQPPPGKYIKLNTNENPYPPPREVVDAIKQAAEGPLNRYPDPIANAFRIAAAEALGLPGPEWVLAGNGSDEILTLLVRGFVGEGEKLRIPFPSYVLYRTLADIQGAVWEQVSFNDQWELPAEFSDAAGNLKLALLPNPNSPSGTVVSRSQIVELSDRLECPLVVDEAYADFADENCVSLVLEHDNILVTRTLSKSYGLAGIRFGFLIAKPEVVAELSKIKDSYNCDAISIAAATAAMKCSGWLAENCRKIIATRTRMSVELEKLGFLVTPSHANFVWCRHQQIRHAEIYEFLKSQQVLVRLMDFGESGDGLRISVGTDQQVDAVLHLLKSYLS